jgi:hypothetical protein
MYLCVCVCVCSLCVKEDMQIIFYENDCVNMMLKCNRRILIYNFYLRYLCVFVCVCVCVCKFVVLPANIVHKIPCVELNFPKNCQAEGS